ncbi:hypothetical protein [Kitasatospora sp. NBC_00315]|uniref:hypothetical protein n=1 Tax=Kitasatospora sp. NBC_00315 TaxID=2975963 RepID=UPI003249159D
MHDQINGATSLEDAPALTKEEEMFLRGLGRILTDNASAAVEQTMNSPHWQDTIARIRASVPANASDGNPAVRTTTAANPAATR